MGRSKQKEIGVIVVENKQRNLAGLVKILSLKKGTKENRCVTFSAVLEIEEGNEEDKKYHRALIVPPVTGYPRNDIDLEKEQEEFIIKLTKYLEEKGYSLYY